jgi:hypothetical protein
VTKEGEPFIINIYMLGVGLTQTSYPADARAIDVVKREVTEEAPNIWNSNVGPFEGCFYTDEAKVEDLMALRKRQIDAARAAGNMRDASPTYITVE